VLENLIGQLMANFVKSKADTPPASGPEAAAPAASTPAAKPK
jgi:hypothetical protein